MIGFFRRSWAGLMPMLVAAASGLPVHSIPQWIDLGSSVNDVKILLDYNSLKRDGQRVGFTATMIPKDESSNYAVFQWVDCQRWTYLFEGESDWCKINSTPTATTLLWSDGVSTQMKFEGDKVLVEAPGIGDLQGVFLSRNPKKMAIQYQGGIIRWCWSSECTKSR